MKAIFFTTGLAAVMASMSVPLFAQSPDPSGLAGVWMGELKEAAVTLRVVFNITSSGAAALAQMSSPWLRAFLTWIQVPSCPKCGYTFWP